MIRRFGAFRLLRSGPASALIVCCAAAIGLAACGGSDSPEETPRRLQEGPAPGPAASAEPSRYAPGDPSCRAREAPGTVSEIGEDVADGAVRAHDFLACFGPPIRRAEVAERDCLYYRQRDAQIYWRFCVQGGRIVSAMGSLPRPG